MISKHLKKNIKLLSNFNNKSLTERKKIIQNGDYSLIIAICEICVNYLKGTFNCSPSDKKKLKRSQKKLRKLVGRKKLSRNCETEKQIINHYGGGLKFLSLVIPPALDYIEKQIE